MWLPPVVRSRSKREKGDAGIWQRRVWEHHVRDAEDLAAHVQYCWMHPVRHGLVARPVEWEWSSFHRDVRRGAVEIGWTGRLGRGAFGER